MDKKMNFKYFYGTEADQFSFYRIPKALFTNDCFKELSSDAKILYGLMLDRMSLSIGDKFEPLKDVTATDEEDGDLTSQIKVINNTVNTKKAGTYEVTYQVTDSQGAAVTKTIKVTVEAKSTPVNPDKDKPDNDKDNGSVETGDRNNLLLWEMMLIGSSIILIYSLYRKKRKTNQ